MSTSLTAGHVAPFSRIAEKLEIPAFATDELLEHLPVALMVVDRDGRSVYANEAARALRVERVEPLEWAIARSLLTEEPVREDEIQVGRVGESRRWLSAWITPMRVAGLGVTAAFVALTDVTARHHVNGWAPMIETLVNL